MSIQSSTTVRMFGALHTFRKKRGLPSVVEMAIPADGCSTTLLAQELDLPLEKIEALFVNHQVYGLEHYIQPGDRMAFVPKARARPAGCSAFSPPAARSEVCGTI